jgi:outer membrane protein assembly factor BamB
MPTFLIVALTVLGILVAGGLGLVALLNRRARRVSALVALGLAAASVLSGLWGLGILLHATAPVPDSVLLYSATFQTVSALSAHDATTRWSASLAPAQASGSPIVQDGVLYASTNVSVNAFRADDGHPLWQSPTAIQVEPGSIGDGMLFGSSVQNGQSLQLAAIALSDGHPLWQVNAPTSPTFPDAISNLLPAAGVVLVGDGQGIVHAQDPTSGAEQWQVALKTGPVVWLTADSSGTVYGTTQEVGTLGSPRVAAQAFALDPQTHLVCWQHALSATTSLLPILTVADGALYLGTETSLVALAATSGSPRWAYPLPNGTGPSQVVVDGGIAYVGTVGGFYALRTSDGTRLWQHADSDTLAFGTPMLSQGIVFTQTTLAGPEGFLTFDSGQHVYAFRARDGFQYYRH